MKDNSNIDQRARDLIHGGFDSELGPAEQQELDRLLEESAEAREFHADLKELAAGLEKLPELEPPSYLQESIERQVRLPVHDAVAKDNKGWLGNWLSAPWLRAGFALAAGVVLTVGVYEMGSGPISETDEASLVGTIAKQQAQPHGTLLDRIQVAEGSVSGFIELREAGDLFTLEVHLNSDHSTGVAVDFAGRGLDFAGITGPQHHQENVTVDGGAIKIAGEGDQSYTLSLRRIARTGPEKPAPLELELFANEELVQTAELRLSVR